ncbi:MAG: class I SAM-dependent methyltransferase [Crocinitomicaceae bacterium]|nr:class I SAM-dependent methyltransferase [Crocinitomicaceae bacterium]MBK9590700.1 class I SAM-dependent methyltransferase [Crocinitomicaceae bacterium]
MQSKLSKQELQDIIQWDVKNWQNALQFWETHFEIKPGMKVLAIGDQFGGISLYFAKKGCFVNCTDYQISLEKAKELHKKYGVENQITYLNADMRALQFGDDTFDIVVFKSVLGALFFFDDQDKAMHELRRVLKKNGALLFAENTRATRLHSFVRRKFVKWSEEWRYTPDADFENWKGLFSRTVSKKIGFIALFGRTERQRKYLASLDSFFKPLIPKKWRYIYLGAFYK